jgi:Uma2 family endonuclease
MPIKSGVGEMTSVDSEMTVADVLEKFGPIPIARIRTKPFPGEATEQDVIDADDHEDRLLELYSGVLVEKVMGFYESYLAVFLSHVFHQYLVENPIGIVVGADGMLKLLPGEVRIPDVSFISWQRLPNRQIPREPIPLLAPDLVVEIISRGNTAKEMQLKLTEYFEAGVRLVWYVYPKRRVVVVHKSLTESAELTENDCLIGEDVLPGFSLSLATLFAPPPTQQPDKE